MHSVGVRKHIQQRQDWLQEHMQDIHTAPMHGGKISSARIMMEHSLSKGVMSETPKRDVVETLEMQWNLDTSLCLRRAICINVPCLISISFVLNILLFIFFYLYIFKYLYRFVDFKKFWSTPACYKYVTYTCIYRTFILEQKSISIRMHFCFFYFNKLK